MAVSRGACLLSGVVSAYFMQTGNGSICQRSCQGQFREFTWLGPVGVFLREKVQTTDLRKTEPQIRTALEKAEGECQTLASTVPNRKRPKADAKHCQALAGDAPVRHFPSNTDGNAAVPDTPRSLLQTAGRHPCSLPSTVSKALLQNI
ncbi:hypothetical protein B0H13DRAFT_1859579 [Mycena leptocephala]|nr:hypothetical protein B0H13DRAFT_1859579 [Mycena leptocephala]